jgi:thiol:disulfide interchange protein DsbD
MALIGAQSFVLQCLMAMLVLTWIASAARAAINEDDLLPVEEAFKIKAVIEGGSLKVSYDITAGYYLYRERLKFNAEAPFSLGAPTVPKGELKDDPNFGLTEIYHQSFDATLPIQGQGAGPLRLTLGYQGCADIGICYPPQRLQLELPYSDVAQTVVSPADPVSALANSSSIAPLAIVTDSSTTAPVLGATQDALPEEEAFKFDAIANSPHELLLRFTPAPGYYLYRDRTELFLQGAPEGFGLGLPRWPVAEEYQDDHFGAVKVYFKQIEVPLELTRPEGGEVKLELRASFQGCKDQGICYPVMTRVLNISLPASSVAHAAREAAPSAAQAQPESATPITQSLWLVLIWALLGGLILNLMPCVLPVLALKALSLAESGHSSGFARQQALWYTIGVLASFALVGALVIALKAAGTAVGWGFQFQHPWFVAILVLVMVAVGLSMSGVVSFGGSLMGVGQGLTEEPGRKGAFFTGVLAVVVASPCTAPMMVVALAYAFAQPPVVSMLVFLTLGLGLALPFLLIGYIPALAKRLPKPGAWMEGFKQVLAFPMYLTAVWLVWVLGQQRGIDAVMFVLGGSVFLAWALWWWERAKYRERLGPLAIVGLVVLVGLVGYSVWLVQKLPQVSMQIASNDGLNKVPFSEAKLKELRTQGTPVFIDMTAAWCATCKVNERVALNTDTFKAALKDTGTVFMVGDWTNADPEITAYLKRYGAVGVPLYVMYPKVGEGKVLPTVLTPSIAANAVREAQAGAKAIAP